MKVHDGWENVCLAICLEAAHISNDIEVANDCSRNDDEGRDFHWWYEKVTDNKQPDHHSWEEGQRIRKRGFLSLMAFGVNWLAGDHEEPLCGWENFTPRYSE